MPEHVLAATSLSVFKTELREYPFPEIPPDAGILKIEAAGILRKRLAEVTLLTATDATKKNGGVLLAATPSATPVECQIGDLLARQLTLKPCRSAIHVTVLPWS